MLVSDGEGIRVRILFGESERWHHRPLHTALLERLRKEGFAGATVFHGIAGFGARSVLHSAHLLRLSEDLPVVVEVIESEPRADELLSIVDEMVRDGIVTLERVRVRRYARGTTGEDPK